LAITNAASTNVSSLYLLYFILPIAFVPVPSRLLSIRFTADTLPVRRANNFEKREKQLAVGWLVGWLVGYEQFTYQFTYQILHRHHPCCLFDCITASSMS
jgi:hypothetical protein